MLQELKVEAAIKCEENDNKGCKFYWREDFVKFADLDNIPHNLIQNCD